MPPSWPEAWQAAAIAMDVAAVPWAGRAGLALRQRQRLEALLAHAAAHSAFYAPRLAGRSFEAVAPVGKHELMAHFADWVTDPRLDLAALRRFAADPARIGEPCLPGHWLWTSSGSTGEPGLFVQDARAMAVGDALEAWRRVLPDAAAPMRWGGDRIAFVGATGGHFASTVSVERLRREVPGLAQALRGISFLQPVEAIVAALHDFAPTVLTTYPTMALLLAEEARAGRLRLAPRAVWTGGETLSPAMRRAIADAFGCPVANSYGASEFLAIASECRHGALHLNADWVLLEPVDAAHRPLPPGRFGETTLLTNLANHAQPLIRYDLGDRVALHEAPCACGSPLPRIEVEGRRDELLVLDDARGRPVRLPPLAVVSVLEEEARVFDFVVAQRGARRLALSVGAAHGRAGLAAARAALADYLASQGLAGVRIDVRQASAGVAPSGKRRRVLGAG